MALRGWSGWIKFLLAAIVASGCLVPFSTSSAPPYPFAIAAVTNIALIGNNIRIDSFDSSNPLYSDWNTNWGYGTYDFAKARANGNVGTCSDIIDAIAVGQANIYGSVNTGPGGTTVIGANGYVGPMPMVGSGIQPGCSNDDMIAFFPDVALPSGAAGWPPVPATFVITNSGNYSIPAITSSLTIDASNVTIFVAGNIGLSGAAITIGTNAAQVTFYVAGPSVSVGGTSLINNLTQHASVLGFYGLPSLTKFAVSGNAAFTGTIYAPEADFLLSGGGSSQIEFVGAIVVHSAEFVSHANFHFDESVAQNMPLWIGSEPTPQIVHLGTNVIFSVFFGGSSPQGCQWFFNQTNLLTGATNAILSLTNVQFTDAGTYSLVASNWSGTITSSPASLIVYTNAAGNLTTPVTLTNGFQFGVTGVSGLNYVVQASTNLSQWFSLATNQPPFEFSDTISTGVLQKYYRVVCFPP